MCGITGILGPADSLPAERLEALVGRMASTLQHRGPDDHGTFVDAEASLALGFRRLAVIDVSPDGAQPMISADGRWVLTFNGEIYNFQDLRLQLQRTGARFRGHSDTEVLLEAIAAWGIEETLDRLNGMFAFAAWDRRERVLSLSRDRLGEKPLFYGMSKGHFLFASELKAIRAHPEFASGIDRDALSLFFRFGYVPAPHSIYRGFSKLPPGTYVQVRSGGVGEPTPYWSPVDVAVAARRESLRLSEDEAIRQLRGLLCDAVGRRMVADVPLGAFLSGGVDSSLIVALMQEQSSVPVKTFSIGFREPEFDESEAARKVAAHLGTDHTELMVSANDALSLVPRLPSVYDEPFADSSQLPTMMVSEMARSDVTVALSGDGGDEVFGGYSRYLLNDAIWGRVSWIPSRIRAILSDIARSIPVGGWDRVFRAARGRWHLSRPGDKVHKLAGVIDASDPYELYFRLMSHWQRPSSLVLGAHEPATAFAKAPRLDLRGLSDWMMLVDTLTYLPDDILTKVDRASMATSLEVRVPLLDHRVVEYAWGLPSDLKIRDGVTKWVLRRLLGEHVPESLVDRPKTGFGVPLKDWLRGPLRGWAEDLLAEDRLRAQGLLDPALVRSRWHEHIAGKRDWKYHLWDVLVFESWLDAVAHEVPEWRLR